MGQRDYNLPECVNDFEFWYTSGCPEECTACGLCRQCHDDCIACEEFYEIDMLYSDGTGNCVINGTASNPVT